MRGCGFYPSCEAAELPGDGISNLQDRMRRLVGWAAAVNVCGALDGIEPGVLETMLQPDESDAACTSKTMRPVPHLCSSSRYGRAFHPTSYCDGSHCLAVPRH